MKGQYGPIWRRPIATTIALLSIALSSTTEAQQGFVGLGDLEGGFFSVATDSSADGSVVVGTVQVTNGLQAFVWTDAEGMVGLGDLPGGTFDSRGFGISADGSTIVGGSSSLNSNLRDEAFRWDQLGEMRGLGALPSPEFHSYALDASADGSTIVGASFSAIGLEAFRWASGGGMVGLGTLPVHDESIAIGVSADGTTAVGESFNRSAVPPNRSTSVLAFRWATDAGMSSLGDIAGGGPHSSAVAISADGTTIVGYSFYLVDDTGIPGSPFRTSRRVFRWTHDEGAVDLGVLASAEECNATGVTADGSTIVGDCRGPTGGQQFIWDASGGMRSLNVGSPGWTISTVQGISDDGKVVFGWGDNPAGTPEAWVAPLPAPILGPVNIVDPSCSTTIDCDGRFVGRVNGRVAITGAPVDLARAAVVRTGAATDGATQLLLRVRSDLPVTFELAPFDPDPGWLSELDGSRPGSSITISPIETDNHLGKHAFAAFHSPEVFPGTSSDVAEGFVVEFRAFTEHMEERTSLRLAPPPLLFVHGVWSDRGAWQSAEAHLKLSGHRVCDDCRINYSSPNSAPSFDPTDYLSGVDTLSIEALIDGVKAGLDDLRNDGIAATRVDVVAHSMGGLVARARAALPTYRALKNYDLGSIHRLITVGTPHFGSPLADWLIAHRCRPMVLVPGNPSLEFFFEELLGKPLGEAIYGFQTQSTALDHLGVTTVDSHPIVGAAPDDSLTEEFLDWIPLTIGELGTTMDTLLVAGTGAHDTIVDTESQRGGRGLTESTEIGGVVHASLGGDTSETEEPAVWAEIRRLILANSIDFGALDDPPANGSSPRSGGTCGSGISATRSIQPTTAVSGASLTPISGTVFDSGETVEVEFLVPNLAGVSGALFVLDGQPQIVQGPSPFRASFSMSRSRVGDLDLHALTYGPDAVTHLVSRLQIVPSSTVSALRVYPGSILRAVGQAVSLFVEGILEDGQVVNLTAASTGTTYETAGGSEQVVSVSPDGLARFVGIGVDTIVVTNDGISTNLTVKVPSPSRATQGFIAIIAISALARLRRGWERSNNTMP